MNRSIRILAGKKKGLKLIAPSQNKTRVTLSRIKQSLFDVLSHNPELNSWQTGGCVIDTFAGSGSLAFEALSRGANKLYLIEITHLAMEVLKKNKALFDYDPAFKDCQIDINCCDFFNLSSDEISSNNCNQPDLIFLDPPFNIYTASQLLKKTQDLFDLSQAIIVYQRATKTKREFELQSAQTDNLDYEFYSIKELIIGSNTFEIFKFV